MSRADRRQEWLATPDIVGQVLAEVRDCGPVTVAEIVANLGASESTVRRTLVQLDEAGLVEWSDYQRRARVYLPVDREEG